MFESARLKLTAWYLFIIMLISIFFSVAFYQVSTFEIQQIIHRLEEQQDKELHDPAFQQLPHRQFPFTLEELEAVKNRLIINLIILNAVILVFSGGAGYFLAGRTLRPIRVMIDEQNQFISSASHELRTPIATMRAEMEGSLLEKQISDKMARGLIASNIEELGTLQELSNSLLRLAQVHNTVVDKSAEIIAVSEIIKAAQKKVAALAKKKKITFVTEGKDMFVIGNKASLIEVFVILFDNAIKYSDPKTLITIKSHQTKKHCVISVADQGIGIPANDIPHIFDRFYRADKSRTSADGYGLGLSIAKKIIEKHNGTITVTSKEKSGTTFHITIPLS